MGPRLVDAALDLLELTELAWHDRDAEVTPADDVVADILVVARGDLAAMIAAAHLAVVDPRDLRVAADTRSARGTERPSLTPSRAGSTERSCAGAVVR